MSIMLFTLVLFGLLGTQCPHLPAHPAFIEHPGVKLLTPDLGLHEHPSWSPDGARLAFSSAPDRGGPPPEIYTMDAQGENRIRLTDNSADDQEPTWSPTGDRIAFVSNRDGSYAIYTMHPDGTDVVRLVEGSMPAWSSDGEKIAFCGGDIERSDIFVWESGQVTRLTNNTYDDYSPIWSPDGQQIVFCSTRQDTNGDGSINYHYAAHLYIMNADGSDQRPLTDGPAHYHGPAWSPDSRWIVFDYYSPAGQEGEGDYGIRLLDLHTGQVQSLLKIMSCRDFAWSPDNKRIAFSVSGYRNSDIYVMDMALMTGGDFSPWMKDGNTMIACCTDAIKPVAFKLERIED